MEEEMEKKMEDGGGVGIERLIEEKEERKRREEEKEKMEMGDVIDNMDVNEGEKEV